MAKITIAGDSIVITSGATLDAIKALEKYAPKALSLFDVDEDGKKEEVFRVASTKSAGSINRYGASFGSTTHDAEKLATITLTMPQGVTDAVEYAYENYGRAVMFLNKVEAQFAEAFAEVAAEKAAIMENIAVVG